LKLRAIAIIPRINGQFHLDQAVIFRSYAQFQGFIKAKVDAVRKGEGYGVALILEPSQVDEDFSIPTLFLDQQHVDALIDAFKKSDELTYQHRGSGWLHGKRPFFKLADFM